MRRKLLFLIFLMVIGANYVGAQQSAHPHLFFDQAGMDALRDRVATDPRLAKIWEKFKVARVDSSFNIQVRRSGTSNLDRGRGYGDALGDLTVAYVVTRDTGYAEKAISMMLDLAELPNWGHHLIGSHISMGMAFAWDVFYDFLSENEKSIIRNGILAKADIHNPNDTYSNVNWTPSAGEGLIGLSFRGDGDAAFDDFLRSLLNGARRNFKEKDRSVLWSHGTDGFPHEGLGYWRKYAHVGLFFKALRFNEPENDWFHLGKEYPGSEFLQNMAYPRIYGDVQHRDLGCLTWSDSRQVRTRSNEEPYGNLATLMLSASEYKDGYVMDFIDNMLNETGVNFNGEDWATFLFYDGAEIPQVSYQDLPLSRYWPDMEAAIFRSGWSKDDLVFYMRSGSPGGHGRRLKTLTPGGHDHPDANGFVLFYNNDYLAAEDGSYPNEGPDADTGDKITYGHNTFLVDGLGQKGDRSTDVATTTANMDFLDAEHVGYLLGDATDAYEGITKFHRSVIYKKHKYIVMLDELADNLPHKYEYLLGTDSRHVIADDGDNRFTVIPENGGSIMPVIFAEPRQLNSAINRDRPYTITTDLTDLLRVWPQRDTTRAAFFSLLYPLKTTDLGPQYEAIYDGPRSGFVVDGDEYIMYNPARDLYSFRDVTTDASLCYFKESSSEFEYLAAGATEFLSQDGTGFRSDEPMVVALNYRGGQIRLGKNLGTSGTATITLYQPGIMGVLIDGELRPLLDSGAGWVTFNLRPKQYTIGPSNAEHTVTDNYAVQFVTEDFLRVSRPNEHDLWAAGSTQTVSWIFAGRFSNVSIDYSTDGGATWTNIVPDAPNSGEYQWLVPNEPSPLAMVRVANSETGAPADVSDQFVIFRSTLPEIGSFNPQTGTIGATVTIHGRHFSGVTGVAFNSVSAEFTIVSDSVITVIVPADATTGPISLASNDGTVVSHTEFTVLRPPTISSFTPTSGLVGMIVTIAGSGFTEVDSVVFNSALADSFTVVSENEIHAAVPEAAISGKIRIVASTGAAESEQDFVVVSPSLSFAPSEDAYVMSSSPLEVRGAAGDLRVRQHATNTVYSFLKFQITGLTGFVQSARIQMLVNLASRDGGAIYSVSNFYRDSDAPWEEEALNWENAPLIEGSTLSAVDSVDIGDIVEFDVTAAISGDGVYSFGLKNASNDLVRYNSKESDFSPRLVIELTPNPGVSPAVASGTLSKPSTESLTSSLPQRFVLKPNYPNPFNNETIIEYGLPASSHVRLTIYNLLGQAVRTLVDNQESAGFKKVQWNGRDDSGVSVSSGIYFVRFEAGNQKMIRKVLLQK